MSKHVEVMSQGDSEREKALNELFSEMGDMTEVVIDLPSKGKFYKNFQGITIEPLTFEDEQKILSSKNKTNIVKNILQNCIKGINVNDLLIMDELYLLMKVRESSYGSDYKFNIVCPECGGSTDVNFDLAQNLNINYVPDEMTDPRELILPVIKKPAVVRFPRSSEQHFISNIDDTIKNIYRFVISINGIEDPVFINKALKKMNIKDMKILTNEIFRNDLGLDNRFTFECPYCSVNTVMAIPLDANFFSVT